MLPSWIYRNRQPRPQLFAFPKDTMDRIFANASPKIIRNLKQTCRLLAKKFPKHFVLDDLEFAKFHRAMTINKYSIKTSPDDNQFWRFLRRKRKIYLINKFTCERYRSVNANLNFSKIPKILNRIERCLIRELWLLEVVIKREDFDLLTAEGTIEVLNLFSCEIRDSLSIDEIIKRVPKAYHISISPSIVTSKTSKKLSKLQHTQKIQRFELFGINRFMDVGYFWEFMTKNFGPNAKMKLVYNFNVQSTEFFELLKQMIECWEPHKEAPALIEC